MSRRIGLSTDDLRKEGFCVWVPILNRAFATFLVVENKLNGNFCVIWSCSMRRMASVAFEVTISFKIHSAVPAWNWPIVATLCVWH